MPDASAPDLSAFARLLGLRDDAGETAILGTIQAHNQARFVAEVERALQLPAGSGLAACVAEIDRVRAEEAASIARLIAELTASRAAIRDLTVRGIMLDAKGEARETLDY